MNELMRRIEGISILKRSLEFLNLLRQVRKDDYFEWIDKQSFTNEQIIKEYRNHLPDNVKANDPTRYALENTIKNEKRIIEYVIIAIKDRDYFNNQLEYKKEHQNNSDIADSEDINYKQMLEASNIASKISESDIDTILKYYPEYITEIVKEHLGKNK